MALPHLILALAAATQPAPPQPPQPQHGRTFISPMGEPFRVGSSAEDGLAAWFRQADRNHDGSVTLDEMKQDAQRFFETLDTNHDGEIDPDELGNYETVVAPEIRSGMTWGGITADQLNDEATGGGALGLLSIPEPVAAADSNFNRGVSALEFEQAATKRFAMLDTNADGRLTLEELEARRQSQRSFSRKPMKPKEAPDAPTMPADESDPNGPG
jgi:Ca2+-binding EF-hand superfamily protein